MFQKYEDEVDKQRKQDIERLKQKLNLLLVDYQEAVEKFARSKSTRWEFTQISTKDKNLNERMKELGLAGWEMIGVTSFTEGTTLGGIGGYTVHFQYTFKRQIHDLPNEILEKYPAITSLQKQINNLESQ